MCVVSFVGDFYSDKFRPLQPYIEHEPILPTIPSMVSKEEFEELKREVEEMKELLIAAKIIDEKTGQPDCEMEEKIALLKKIAEAVGVDLSEVFG